MPNNYVCLSYPEEDRLAARWLYKELMLKSVSVWFDEEDSIPNLDPAAQIDKAVRDNQYAILLLSSKFISRLAPVTLNNEVAQTQSTKRNKVSRSVLKIELELCGRRAITEPTIKRDKDELHSKAEGLLGELLAFLKFRFKPFVDLQNTEAALYHGIYPHLVDANACYFWFLAQFPRPGEIPSNYLYFVIGYDFDNKLFELVSEGVEI